MRTSRETPISKHVHLTFSFAGFHLLVTACPGMARLLLIVLVGVLALAASGDPDRNWRESSSVSSRAIQAARELGEHKPSRLCAPGDTPGSNCIAPKPTRESLGCQTHACYTTEMTRARATYQCAMYARNSDSYDLFQSGPDSQAHYAIMQKRYRECMSELLGDPDDRATPEEPEEPETPEPPANPANQTLKQ